MEEAREMEKEKSWKTEVEEIVAKQAYALNYEYGITSRVLPIREDGDSYVLPVALDLTHSSHEFDMVWSVRFGQDAAAGLSAQLVGPEEEGGEVWEESYWTADDFRKAVAGIPWLVRGFFAGRATRPATDSAEVSRKS